MDLWIVTFLPSVFTSKVNVPALFFNSFVSLKEEGLHFFRKNYDEVITFFNH